MSQGDRSALVIDGFAGTDERYAVNPDRAVDLRNVRWDQRGGWERMGGMDQILQDAQGVNPFAGQGKVQSIHWFSEHNGGPQWLLWEMGTKLVYLNGSANSWVTLKTDRFRTDSPWQHTQYAASGGSCWIVNGYNEPIRFHFGVTYKAGFDGPAPPVIADGYVEGFAWGTSYRALGLGEAGIGNSVIGAVGQDNGTAGGGEYAYLLTEMNEFGTMSPPSPVYASVKWTLDPDDLSRHDVNTKYFVRVRIPSPSGDHVVRRLLWRTKNLQGLGVQEGTRYYLCAELQGAGSFPFVDALPDQYLGAELPLTGVGIMPRDAKYMVIWKSRAWYAGTVNDPDSVYASAPFDFENVPATNRYPVGNADSGEIMGMRESSNCLVVYKRRGVFLIMELEGGDGFTTKTVTLEKGCSAPNSIRDVPGYGQFFVSDDGVNLLVGSYQQGSAHVDIRSVSETLPDYWRWRVNRSALVESYGCVHHLDHEYWLSIPTDGNPDNKMVLVYHYDTGAWTFRPKMNAACMTETHDHRSAFYIGSNDDTSHPGVHVYTPWFATLDGDAFTLSLSSSWTGLPGVYTHFSPTSLLVRCMGYGDPSMAMFYYHDRRESTPITIGGQSRLQDDSEYLEVKPDRWGNALWGASYTWPKAYPIVLRYDVGAKKGAMRELQYTLEATGRSQLIGVSLYITTRPENKVTNPILGTGTAE